MRITSWNARGLNAPSKKWLLKQNLIAFESEIILLQETKLDKAESTNIGKKIRQWQTEFQESIGASGGLGMIWNPRKVNLNIINKNPSWISSRVISLKNNLEFLLINIYGPTPTLEKIKVWQEISDFLSNHSDITVVIGGDFNAIMSMEEKYGGSQITSQITKEFKRWT